MEMVNRNPTTRELHKFGGAMLLGFGIIAAVLWYFGPEPNTVAWAAVFEQKLAIALLALGVLLLGVSYGPRSIAQPTYVAWMSVAMRLGTVVTFLLLTVLFFVLLPVFSLIRFADPLRLKLKPAGESYWEEHKHHESTLERASRPF